MHEWVHKGIAIQSRYNLLKTGSCQDRCSDFRDHLSTLKVTLESVFVKHPDVKNEPQLICNMNETEVAGETGRKLKIETSEDSSD